MTAKKKTTGKIQAKKTTEKIEPKAFYRIDKKGTYDWVLTELKDGKETIIKEDIMEICWAFLKKKISEGV